MQRVIIPISAMLLLSACLGSRRDGMPVQPVVIQAPPAVVASPEQIAWTAKDMASRIDSSRSAASSIQDRADGLGARVPEAKPDAGAISASASSIVADQDALRRTLASSEAEVVKMRGEVDRLRAETAAAHQRLASLTLAREDDQKAAGEALKTKDAEINRLGSVLSGNLAWSFRAILAFSTVATIGGLCLLYFRSDKLRGIGAILIGLLGYAIGMMLPSMADAAKGAGATALKIVLGVLLASAAYLIGDLAWKAWKGRPQ